MTLHYAKIASRTVADEYFAVTGKVEALYGQAPVLPADARPPRWPGCAANTPGCSATAMHPAPRARLRLRVDLRDLHLLPDQHRVPPVLVRQRDHARDHGQSDRAALFDGLIQRARSTERS